MKKLMFALCFVVGGTVAVTAQDTTSNNQYRTENPSQFSQDAMTQQDRERIQATELPEEVKRELEGAEYRGWLISGAFKSQGQSATGQDANATRDEGQEVFIIELKNGAETKTVAYDSRGEKVEGMDNLNNGQDSRYNPGTPAPDQNDPLRRDDQTDPTSPADQSLPTDRNQIEQPGQPGQSPTNDPSLNDPATGTPSQPSTSPQSPARPGNQSDANRPK